MILKKILFQKKETLLLCVLLFFLTILLLPIFRTGIFTTHDGENHIARIAAYSEAIQDGQFPVRWAGGLNYGYGSPVFIFFYPLPYILGSIVYFAGFGLEETFKILIAFSSVAAFFSFYYFSRGYLATYQSFIASLLYILLPYHFLNRYVRGDIGELFALALLPLIIGSIDRISKNQNTFWSFIIFIISLSGLYLSHNGISLIFFPIIFLYGLFHLKGKTILYFFTGSVWALIIASFFIIPALFESKYTLSRQLVGNFYASNFASIFDMFLPRWGFGPNIREVGGLSPHIGVVNTLIVIISFITFSKKMNRKYVFWVSVFLSGIFMSSAVSEFFWDRVELLKILQFPWRFLVLSSFASSVLVVLFFTKVKNSIFLLCCLILAGLFSFQYISTNNYKNNPDKYYTEFPGSTYYHGEASSIWSAGDPASYAKQPLEIIEGKGSLKNITRKSQVHTFTAYSESGLKILDNTLFFPGWRVFADDTQIPVEFQSSNQRGFITFIIPPGQHSVEVVFGETKIRLISNLLTLLGITALLVLVFIRKEVRQYFK